MICLYEHSSKTTACWVSAGESRFWKNQRSRRRKPSRRILLELLEDRVVLSGFTPSQIQAAYGINRIQLGSAAVAGNGAGQTIALIEFDVDPYIASDLQTFDSLYSTSGLNLSTFGSFAGPVSGSTLPWFNMVWSPTNTTTTPVVATSAPGETALDVEWAHAIAPMANILVVESDSLAAQQYNAAAAYAASYPGVSVVSMSHAEPEVNDDSDFVTPSNDPVTFLAAAGDDGDINALYPAPLIAYPATSPDVIAVGATSLTTNPDGSYNSETGWSFLAPKDTFVPVSLTGTWTASTGGFSGGYSSAAVGSNSTATWSIGIPADDVGHNGRTEVSATWVASATNSTHATFLIYNGTVSPSNLVATVPVNESLSPTGTLDGDYQFQELGDYAFGATMTVVLDASSSTGGTSVVADTIGITKSGAGGGMSMLETKPSYQIGVTPGTQRATPDVSFNGNPDTGVDTYQSYLTSTPSAVSGGSSLSAPCWAGLIAIADQDLALAGKPLLSSTTALTELYQLASSNPYDFHTILSGYNGNEAGPGYNLVTGLGSPVGNLLVADLAGVAGPLDYIAPEGTVSNNLTPSVTGGNLDITDNGTLVAYRAVADVTLVNIYTPESTTLGDTLTIDYGSLGANFSVPIEFHGDNKAGSQYLAIEGGSFTRETYTTSSAVGTIAFQGAGNPSIQFDHLTSLADTSPVLNFTIDGTSAAEPINLVDDPNGPANGFQATEVNSGSGDTFQAIDFANKTNVTVDGVAGADTFTIDNPSPALGLTALTVNGGTSTGDLFDVVTVPPGVTTDVVGGQGGDNTLDGPNQSDTWNITGSNQGNIPGLIDSFLDIQNLTGGSQANDFIFSNGAAIAGNLYGGGGGSDWLDYSAYQAPVTVNLGSGMATAVLGGMSGIQDLRGSNFGDTLVGDSQPSVLLGGAGADVISGGSGQSILIGEEGKDVITAGSGGAILIGGVANYDGDTLANDMALESILAEWQSAQSYKTRVTDILNGGGLNGTNRLVWKVTVHDDLSANKLTGGAGQNWLFKGVHDKLFNMKRGQRVN